MAYVELSNFSEFVSYVYIHESFFNAFVFIATNYPTLVITQEPIHTKISLIQALPYCLKSYLGFSIHANVLL